MQCNATLVLNSEEKALVNHPEILSCCQGSSSSSTATAATKGVKDKTENNAILIFDKGLCDLLGFEPRVIEGIAESPFVADPQAAFPIFYVYSDIVQPQVVGDIQAPLLRVVRVMGKDGEVVSCVYDRPHYVPVIRQQFQKIQIETRLNS